MEKCKICNKEVENWIEVDGDFYCEHCIEEVDDVSYCEDCGEHHYSENMFWIEDTECMVCEDCFNKNGYFCCDDCGRCYSEDNCCSVDYGNRQVCERCLCGDYVYINCCDTYIDSDHAYYDEDEDVYYCGSCYHNRREIVDYHGFSDWKKHTLENEEPAFCIGFELEVENTRGSYSNNDLARFAKNNYPVICSRDSSIEDGFEIVSHPLSYNYIVENKDKLKYMLEELSNRGCESHNPGTCGLHFHITHPHNDDIIDRIILIMETYKQEIIAFSRRTSSQIENWCKFLSDVKENDDCKSLYFIKKNKNTLTRYMALNLTNYNTIEFRIFRGTLKFDTFMASVELVNNIVTLCSDLSIPVEEITWDRLTETQYAHTYCDKRNIRTTIIPHSNDEKYLEEERKLEKLKKDVKEFIENDMIDAIKNHIKIDLQGDRIIELQYGICDIRRHLDILSNTIDVMNSVLCLCNNETYLFSFVDRCNIFLTALGNIDGMEEQTNKLKNILKESE